MKPGTLVYVKDYRISPQKKADARFLRAPSMVVREYPTVVFHRTLAGVILRDHKRNLKICPPRDLETFQKLPTKIKTILGGVFDGKTFTKYANQYLLFKSIILIGALLGNVFKCPYSFCAITLLYKILTLV